MTKENRLRRRRVAGKDRLASLKWWKQTRCAPSKITPEPRTERTALTLTLVPPLCARRGGALDLLIAPNYMGSEVAKTEGSSIPVGSDGIAHRYQGRPEFHAEHSRANRASRHTRRFAGEQGWHRGKFKKLSSLLGMGVFCLFLASTIE